MCVDLFLIVILISALSPHYLQQDWICYCLLLGGSVVAFTCTCSSPWTRYTRHRQIYVLKIPLIHWLLDSHYPSVGKILIHISNLGHYTSVL